MITLTCFMRQRCVEGRVVIKRALTSEEMIIEGIRNALRANPTNLTRQEVQKLMSELSTLERAGPEKPPER